MCAKSIKENLQSLVNKANESKRIVPIQMVVPVDEHKPIIETTKKKESIKHSIKMYVEDWLELMKFQSYKIIKDKNIHYNFAAIIGDGLELLEKKYPIERGMQKISLKRGTRSGSPKKEARYTSVDLSQEQADLMNDFLHYKTEVQQLFQYTKMDFISDILAELKVKHPEAFK
ncbi:hypothetical protein [Elizabethkingia anophelis]|uniref:hypothetical protein n=1 Tax=Elizabethkingia anophelis TaxID=1117645 RepID=UPI0002ACC858|nr:hypothetical protein [Elizabethkingia anophelis]ELR81101.1 hypothetical protein D505_01035 [Elizabethkingia anophelis R26]MCS7369662.1 hypothetical protein [Elizabethkingia anophelis]MCS7374979.1 hypothetical protein [Elizabethkingia anophelis]MCS7387323.1 hypothetical protein [Elizabethkingia anophelis]HAY3597913.1 hypothetical protein [Elizabethkingia anophelis]